MTPVDDDIAWLKKLQEDLWPPEPPPPPRARGNPYAGMKIELDAKRTLTKKEFERVLGCIKKHKLVANMFSTSMFGGYGMKLYEHEPYPGTGAQFLVTIIEGHLPVPTRYDRIAGNVKEKPKKHPGCGREDAWKVFSKYTHTKQNRAWLKQYGLPEPHDQSYYDY